MGKPVKILFVSTPGRDAETVLRKLESAGYDPVSMSVNDLLGADWTETLAGFLDGEERGVDVCAGRLEERREIEEALEESERRYQNLFELAPDAVFVSVKGQIVLVNDAGVRLFGARSAGELIGKRILDFTHEASVDMMEARWKTLLEECRPVPRMEIKLRRMDGAVICVESVHAPVLYKGIEAVQSVLRDVTARRKAEEALLLQQKQLRALASKVSLVAERERHRIAGSIHDGLGQVLSLIKMKLDMLLAKDHAPQRTKPRIGEVRNLVEQAISQIHSIIHELSPPILHKMGLEAALEWLANKAREETGMPVSFVSEGVPVQTGKDAAVFIYHAAGELIHNAVKHARAKGVRVTLKNRADGVEINVEDDGVGFDPVVVSESAGGTGGFGLFNIGIRCEQMGGSFRVDSAPGMGTRVTITIPASKSS